MEPLLLGEEEEDDELYELNELKEEDWGDNDRKMRWWKLGEAEKFSIKIWQEQIIRDNLVEEAKRGDARSLNTLMKLTEKILRIHLWKFISKYPRHIQDHFNDIIQETLIKCSRLEKFDWRSQFSTWAFRVGVNTLMDVLRKIWREEKRSVAIDGLNENTIDAITAEDERVRDEVDTICLKLLVHETLDEFPTEIMLMIKAVYFDYTQLTEYAREAGIPQWTAFSRLYNARRRFQLALIHILGNEGYAQFEKEMRWTD